MVVKLEQTSEPIAEVSKSAEAVSEAKPEVKQLEPLAHVAQVLDLTVIPNTDSPCPNVKCFHLMDGKIMFGILLSETTDSFLVGAGARLIMGADKSITAEPMTSEPVFRMMKTAVLFVTRSNVKFLYHYYTFLRDSGKIYLPQYLDDKKMSYIANSIETYELEHDVGFPEPETVIKMKVDIPGASELAFIPLHISEKIQ